MIPSEYRHYPALSIRQPWAWLILNAGKDIENRSWQTQRRGWFLIHAAKGCTKQEFADAKGFAYLTVGVTCEIPDLGHWSMHQGGIVGAAKIGNCVRGSSSPWFVGEWGFVLDEVKTLGFIPCKGSLGFFTPQWPSWETPKPETKAP